MRDIEQIIKKSQLKTRISIRKKILLMPLTSNYMSALSSAVENDNADNINKLFVLR